MTDFTQYSMPSDAQAQRAVVNRYMMKIYNWMAAGLGISALCAYIAVSSPTVFSMFIDVERGGFSFLWWGCVIAQFVLVFMISSRIQKMQASTSSLMFIVYAALNGFTLSPILLVFTAASVAKAFVMAAVTFLAASVYGTVTKRDLTSMGSYLFMGLIGIIIAMLINMFFQSSTADYVISFIGVILFTALTAYDSQKLKRMMGQAANEVTVSKMAIFGALTLYLDFINLFIMLLRFMGDRR